MNSIGATIKAMRNASRLTQEELAERVGVHVASVRNWEKGSIPQTAVAKKIAEVLNIQEIQLRPAEVTLASDMDIASMTKELHRKVAEAHGVKVEQVKISIEVTS